MSRFNRIGGRYGFHSGSGRFKNLQVDQSMFLQGSVLGQGCQGTIYYVDKTRSASGDGKSWDHAFKTVTEGFAALSNYDWLIIGPGNYDEASPALILSGLYGVKILGYATGMQWSEGSTCIRDVTSSDDLIDIDGCRAIEIAGISFINSGAYDAINIGVTTGCYSIHIHDCCFTGDTGGGATGLYGINLATGSAPDTYVHDCKFFHYATTGLHVHTNQRFVCHDCFFIVPNNGIGIDITGAAASYQGIWDCKFLGSEGDSAEQGLDIGAATSDGKLLVTDCRFAGCTVDGGGTGAEVAFTECYENSATGGALIDPT